LFTNVTKYKNFIPLSLHIYSTAIAIIENCKDKHSPCDNFCAIKKRWLTTYGSRVGAGAAGAASKFLLGAGSAST
jgi:hypothetical protein